MKQYNELLVLFLAVVSVFGGYVPQEQGRVTWEEGYGYSHRANLTLCEIDVNYTVHPRWYGLVITTDGTTSYHSGNTYNSSSWYLVEEGACFTFNNTQYYLHKVIDGLAVVEQIDMAEWSDY